MLHVFICHILFGRTKITIDRQEPFIFQTRTTFLIEVLSGSLEETTVSSNTNEFL